MTIHNIAATMFLISASAHVVMNWKIILKFLVTRTTTHMKLRKESVIAAIAVVVVIGLAVSHVFHVGR